MYKTLDGIQSKLLKRVVGAYKATNPRIVERELEIQPITSHLTQLVVSAYNKEKEHKTDEIVTTICGSIQASARARGRKRLTPYQELAQWITKEKLKDSPQLGATDSNRTKAWTRNLHEYLEKEDNQTWDQYTQREVARNHQYPAITDSTKKGRLERYKLLTAAEAAAYVQIRTEKIGLNSFLKDRKVPNVNAECSCGWAKQTAKHVIMFCPKWNTQRQALKDTTGFTKYSQLTDNKENAKVLAKWLISLGLLNQFNSGLSEE